MPDERNRIAEDTVGERGNRDRFHQGNNPQILPLDLTEEEQATLDQHRATIHAPDSKPRWGTDEDGEPIEVSPQGLIVTDPLTGAVEPLTEESAERAERNQKLRAEQAEARFKSGALGASPPPLPGPERRTRAPSTKGDEPATEHPPKPEPRASGGKAPSS
jgi:hypothetical protein